VFADGSCTAIVRVYVVIFLHRLGLVQLCWVEKPSGTSGVRARTGLNKFRSGLPAALLGVIFEMCVGP